MMQRDEDLLLRPWLLYHGYLFGFENIYVYDNGSTSPAVLATLNEFAAVGVNVDRSRNEPVDFERKGFVLGDKISGFKENDLYDVALPLDCDEFLAINGKNGIQCSKTEILEELQRIFDTGIVCRTSHCLDNRPGYFDVFRYVGHVKSIVVVREFLGIDHGFHQATLRPELEYGVTALIHIHMHFKPFQRVLAGAKNKLAPYLNVDDRAALASFEGVGNHLKKYFFMSERDFYSDLLGYRWPFARFGGLQRLLAIFGDLSRLVHEWEGNRPAGLLDDALILDLDRTPFIPARYYEANPDLFTTEFDPFLHFLRAGYVEGRRLVAGGGGNREVADRLEEIRSKKRDGISGFVGLAMSMNRLERALEAEEIISRGIAVFGKTKKLLRELALSAMYREAHDVASERWAEFRSLFPDDPDGYRFGAVTLRRKGDAAQAEQIASNGLTIFPDCMELAIEQAEIAVAGRDWERATDLWRSLLERFPNNHEIRERAGRTAFQLRLWRSEQSEFHQVDAMDGPVIVGISEDEQQVVLARLGLRNATELRNLFMSFESLGHSCEFGLVQRRYGAEPISLLRWNSIHIEQLIRGLKMKFSGISDPNNLVLFEGRGEYILRDLTYATVMHTFTYLGEVLPETFLVKQAKRMEFLREKLIGDLEAGEKIFVFLDDKARPVDQIEQLRQAFRAYGTGLLLYVQVAETRDRIGSVHSAGDGLFLGYIERLGRGADGHWDIAFDSWLTICQTASELKSALQFSGRETVHAGAQSSG